MPQLIQVQKKDKLMLNDSEILLEWDELESVP